ncbi:hypothetical protein pb186bvf_015721 [Paramecium bursaria]
MDDNYISLMDQQAVSQIIHQQPSRTLGTINQNVITKTNDYNNIELQTLKNNQSLIIFTHTPGTEWLTFQFVRKEKLLKIIGQLYSNDQRTYSIECQYQDSKQQWVPNFNAVFRGQLEQIYSPPMTAYGIRFKGKSNIDDCLQLTSFNILAKANRPYVIGQNPWENAFYLHDKYEIVNIMQYQPIYKKIGNHIIVNHRPVITKQNDEQKYHIDDLKDNKIQTIHSYCQYPKWLTFEFSKKYKLSQIEISTYIEDKRIFNYEIEVMDKKKNWKQVDTGKSGLQPILIQFPNFFSSYGTRFRGTSNINPYFSVVSLKILAQRGKPVQI